MQGFKEITFKGSLEHFIEKVKNLITGFFGFNTNERVSYERAINNRKQCHHNRYVLNYLVKKPFKIDDQRTYLSQSY